MSATLPTRGRAIGVYRGDSPETLVAGVRTKSLSISGSPIDDTNDGDAGVRSLLNEPGQVDVSISVSGILASEQFMAEALNTSDRVQTMELRWPGASSVGKFRGDFFLEGFTLTGEYQGAATFEATFQSAGAITFTPAV